jgi:hypothetical protein
MQIRLSNDATMRRCYDARFAPKQFYFTKPHHNNTPQKHLFINLDFMTSKPGVYDE